MTDNNAPKTGLVEKWNALSKGGKFLVGLIILAVVGAALGGSGSSDDSTPAPVEIGTPKVQYNTDSTSRARCSEWAGEVAADLSDVATEASYVTTEADARRVISSGRSAVAEGRRMLAECRQFAPAEASSLEDSLDTLDVLLDSLDAML